MLIKCTAYQKGIKLADIEKNQISSFIKKADCVLWVALQDPEHEELLEMQEQFDLPELAVEDASHGHQRPKIEEYSDSIFAVLRLPVIKDDDLEAGELSIFVGKNYVLSVRSNSSQEFSHIRKRLEADGSLLEIGAGAIFYALIDGVVDLYFPILYTLENELENLEENIFTEQASRSLIKQLYILKNKVMQLKNSVEPLLEDLAKLQGKRVPKLLNGIQEYFRDVIDHLNRIAASVELMRETVHTAMQANISLVAIEDSQINKRLASWAGIFAVAAALVGVWGMNFDFMPELKWKLGYPLAVLIIVSICGYLYYKFKKSGWL